MTTQQTTMRSVSTLTTFAKEIQEIQKYHQNSLQERKECCGVLFHETLDHDGYDEEGPNSNLWDLYVIEVRETNEGSTVHHYHREEWYSRKESFLEPYQFVETIPLLKIWDLDLSSRIHSFRKGI